MLLEVGADLLFPLHGHDFHVLADAGIGRGNGVGLPRVLQRPEGGGFGCDQFLRGLGLDLRDLLLLLDRLLDVVRRHDPIRLRLLGRHILGQVGFLDLGLLLGERGRGYGRIGVRPRRQIGLLGFGRGQFQPDLDRGRAERLVVVSTFEMRDRKRGAAEMQRQRGRRRQTATAGAKASARGRCRSSRAYGFGAARARPLQPRLRAPPA